MDAAKIRSWYVRLGSWRCGCGYRFLAGGPVPKHDSAIDGFGCTNGDLEACNFEYNQTNLALIKTLVKLTARALTGAILKQSSEKP